MKYIYKGIGFLILIFSFSSLQAQTETLNFKLISDTVNASGQNAVITSTLEKIGNSLEWTQQANGSADVTNFTITGVTGNWNQTTSTGSITYTMTVEGYQSKLTLIGEATSIVATLSVNVTAIHEEKYIFNINAISYQ